MIVHTLKNRFQDGVAYQDAVQYAMDNTDPAETLIISTADHGHAIAYNGYCGRGSPVTGLCMEIDPTATMHAGVPNFAADGATYTVVSVGNGPGSILYQDEEVFISLLFLLLCCCCRHHMVFLASAFP